MSADQLTGACNIGGEQFVRRKRFLAKCLGLTAWAIFLIEIFAENIWWRLAAFPFFALSALAVQQVYLKFCYVFGLKGVYGMEEPGKVQQLENEELRKAARRRSIKMILTSVLIGMLLTAVYFYLGAFLDPENPTGAI